MSENPFEVEGELYIGGEGVALGYLGDEKKTGILYLFRLKVVAASFFLHPITREKLYKTGDLAKRVSGSNGIPAGTIVLIGRKDFQVCYK